MKTALAHQNNVDAGISATLHIDPADQPLVGKEAKFYFVFQDESGTFDIRQCDCSITLSKDGKQVEEHNVQLEDPSFAALGDQPLLTKTFSDEGVYDVQLIGKPKDGAVFSTFTLNYHVQVGGNSFSLLQHHLVTEHLGHIIIFGGGFIAAIALLVRNHLENRKKAIRKNSEKN